MIRVDYSLLHNKTKNMNYKSIRKQEANIGKLISKSDLFQTTINSIKKAMKTIIAKPDFLKSLRSKSL